MAASYVDDLKSVGKAVAFLFGCYMTAGCAQRAHRLYQKEDRNWQEDALLVVNAAGAAVGTAAAAVEVAHSSASQQLADITAIQQFSPAEIAAGAASELFESLALGPLTAEQLAEHASSARSLLAGAAALLPFAQGAQIVTAATTRAASVHVDLAIRRERAAVLARLPQGIDEEENDPAQWEAVCAGDELIPDELIEDEVFGQFTWPPPNDVRRLPVRYPVRVELFAGQGEQLYEYTYALFVMRAANDPRVETLWRMVDLEALTQIERRREELG